MALDLASPGAELVALALASGANSAQLGIELSPATRLSVHVTLGSIVATSKVTGGVIAYDIRYRVLWAYRLSGNTGGTEATAESALLAAVPAFIQAVQDDPTLNGTCQGATIDLVGSDEPEYRALSGTEWREVPVVVSCRQYGTFDANP